MSGTVAVLAFVGLALALGAVVHVLVLLNRVLKPLREIKRYADDIREAAVAVSANLEGVRELEGTREHLRRLGVPVS